MEEKEKVTSIGWPSYTMLFITITFMLFADPPESSDPNNPLHIFSFWEDIFMLFSQYAGAIIGNFIRINGMPSAYFTDGSAWGGFKARFYWAYGPQFTGLIFGWIGSFFLIS